MTDPLDETLALRSEAMALRSSMDNDGAHAVLTKLIELLRALKSGAVDVPLRARFDAELQDARGMKAVLYRRCGDLRAALAEHLAALAEEEPGAKSTFNLSKVVLLTVLLDPVRIADGSMVDHLDTLAERLQACDRSLAAGDSWWVFSDLTLVHLLRGNWKEAHQAFEHALASGPREKAVQQLVNDLAQLVLRIEQLQPELADGIRQFMDRYQRQRFNQTNGA